ncbi:succinate dehydrogenase assembly factor 2 [Paracoccaceae bacterium]|jgi:antitoxin CptB|nr:succinate dehydrogenase assembly factor 2 [Paracoccaceae bacterium]
MITETYEIRLKRLKMRSMRRGIKEMDIILSGFSDLHLIDMSGAQLDLYEDFLDENDQDLYQWVSGQVAGYPQYEHLLKQIKVYLKSRY